MDQGKMADTHGSVVSLLYFVIKLMKINTKMMVTKTTEKYAMS